MTELSSKYQTRTIQKIWNDSFVEEREKIIDKETNNRKAHTPLTHLRKFDNYSK